MFSVLALFIIFSITVSTGYWIFDLADRACIYFDQWRVNNLLDIHSYTIEEFSPYVRYFRIVFKQHNASYKVQEYILNRNTQKAYLFSDGSLLLDKIVAKLNRLERTRRLEIERKQNLEEWHSQRNKLMQLTDSATKSTDEIDWVNMY